MQENNDSLDDKKSPYLIGKNEPSIDEPSIDELSSRLEKSNQEKEKLQNELHEEKAKRTKDSSETIKWIVGIATVVVIGGISGLSFHLYSFNKELRDIRDRLTIIETERKIEKAQDIRSREEANETKTHRDPA
ncbi:MAG: hypothetical protein OXC62_10760 [Aestuariivita sp.]|nr:hypothetical protein [Aestuariivita sp.]